MIKKLSFGALIFFSVSSASAALVDNGIHTTAAGLDWLDLTESDGLSYNYVSSQFGSGGAFEGYRYASSLEVSSLFDAAGGTPPYDHILPPDTAWVEDLITLWGILRIDFGPLAPLGAEGIEAQISEWYTGDAGDIAGTHKTGALVDCNPAALNVCAELALIFSGTHQDTIASPYQGHALVRSVPAVPVPAAVWLFGTALIGFVGMSRRRKVA